MVRRQVARTAGAAAHGALRSRQPARAGEAGRARGRGLPALRRVSRLLLSFHRRGLPDPERAWPRPRSSGGPVFLRSTAALAGARVRAPPESRDADGDLPEARMKTALVATSIASPSTLNCDRGRQPARLRAWFLAITNGLLVSAGALVMLPIGLLTLFQARR